MKKKVQLFVVSCCCFFQSHTQQAKQPQNASLITNITIFQFQIYLKHNLKCNLVTSFSLKMCCSRKTETIFQTEYKVIIDATNARVDNSVLLTRYRIN